MKIAVFGTGMVGQTIAEKLVSLGHEVKMATRDVVATLSRTNTDNMGRPGVGEWIKSNSAIKLEMYSEAAAWAEFIVNATNGSGTMPALEAAGEKNLSVKVMLDISNPLDFSKGMPPTLFVCNNDSLGEQIQRKYPDLKVVKSLNTTTANIMVNPNLLPEPTNIFMNGNDADAKARVKELLKSFGWEEDRIVDLGDITTARGTEQILPIWIRLYGALQTPMFNFKIVKA